MAVKEFKAESKRLLDLMINSIYTHKEIFMRELISNASDAIDKLYYLSLEKKESGIKREDFNIRVLGNEKDRTLIIADNGVGMSKSELENNLGIIAKSGSFDFKSDEKISKEKEIDIIGQFGVGFYSAFMVSEQIEVISKSYETKEENKWVSNGGDGYEVSKCSNFEDEMKKIGFDDSIKAGTIIKLTLRKDTKEEQFSEFLSEWKIKELIKKYSDYIRFPIIIKTKKTTTLEEKDENGKEKTKEEIVDETINSMVPIWKKQKSKIKDEELNEFYKSNFHDYIDPFFTIQNNVEGVVSYNSLLFIPKKPPFDYYSKEYKKGLALYSSGVMIMEKCETLLPDYLGFIRGVVDTDDLSLNISRELLQNDVKLKAIAERLKKKIIQELKKMYDNDFEKYREFFESFGSSIKLGIYQDFGMNKDDLKDFLIYESSKKPEKDDNKKLTSIKEYVSRMKDKQEFIYYAIADTIEKAKTLPGTEVLLDKGFEILYMDSELDDFVVKTLSEYDGKKFKSVTDNDLGIKETKKEQEENKKAEEDYKEVLTALKDTLKDKVKDVRFSSRLKKTPVVLVSGGEISFDMEKMFKRQMGAGDLGMQNMKAERILEINPNSEITKKIKENIKDKDYIKRISNVLYSQATLAAGFEIDDLNEYSNDLFSLI